VTLIWRKSSRSGGAGGDGNTGDCVEVAFGPNGPLVRDSKTGDHDRVLHTTPTAFAALLDSVKR
jgi:uncharacterized protein DUF397